MDRLTHGYTCAGPHCPYLYSAAPGGPHSCRKERPRLFQPDLRRNENLPVWPTVDPDQDWCGEHPSIKVWVERHTKRMRENA